MKVPVATKIKKREEKGEKKKRKKKERKTWRVVPVCGLPWEVEVGRPKILCKRGRERCG